MATMCVLYEGVKVGRGALSFRACLHRCERSDRTHSGSHWYNARYIKLDCNGRAICTIHHDLALILGSMAQLAHKRPHKPLTGKRSHFDDPMTSSVHIEGCKDSVSGSQVLVSTVDTLFWQMHGRQLPSKHAC